MNLADQVPHLFVLGLEVALVGGLAGDLGGEALGNFDAGRDECVDLLRIVGDQADSFDAERFEDCGRKFVGAAVGGVA